MYKEGFLMNAVNFQVNQDSFYDSHHSSIYIDRQDKMTVKSYESALRYELVQITKTLGEFFEREVLVNSIPIKRKQLPGCSLLDGEIKMFETRYLVFSDTFVDSCGMSSHYKSLDTITSSFYEFVERQSLILNYLAKSSAVKVDIKRYETVLSGHLYLKNFIDDISYYDISLHPELHVILSIGTGNENKSVGLGTHNNLEQALLKSQNEMIQYFAGSTSKYNFTGNGYTFSENEDFEMDKDYYHIRFEEISPQELKEMYSYLQSSPYMKVAVPHNTNMELRKVVQDLYLKYAINPFVICIPSKRNIPNLKTTKIVDPLWFPHMNPSIYKPELFDHIEGITGLRLDRACKFIPFP
ncbi:YcaO-like family protein [Paenibacillus illinoisensis]|uniref:YcaO domain-containing protein n=1 Tax=Paenibacillus illinoisensis TaxID=59845 RepID=A0A2W0CQ10_9BACL|nr:YcaO-like family protein [Paenibacillus illinoisensis]PYY29738.1 hypothetical protein PIL02S_01938 [Paenibacillus illinoisensis]